MGKYDIIFNNKKYDIDESSLSSAADALKSHLSTVMNGSGAVINLGGISYNVDSTKLSDATTDFINHLGNISGNGYKVVIGGTEYSIASDKVASVISGLETAFDGLHSDNGNTGSLVAGLYETGSNYTVLKTSWDDLVANGVINISEGEDLPDDLTLNEYGFYYGVKYSMTIEGISVGFIFNEDGSAVYDEAGQTMDIPAGAIVYEDHIIDMSDLDMPIFEVSDDGTMISGDGFILYLGSGLPPKGTVYVGTINGEKPMLEGDLVLANDGHITSIGNFMEQSSLTSIIIPDSVTTIGDNAFAYCTGLTSVIIPDSVTTIGVDAFAYCTGLTSIEIGNGITIIREDDFYHCESLTSVKIGSGVSTIVNRVFSDSKRLTSITVNDSNKKYHSSGNCIIETSSKTLIAGYGNSTIPTDNSVTSIGDYAFYNCSSLTSITIPDSVTSIGERAFWGCDLLTSITIPDSVTSIGVNAFSQCSSLKSIEIGNSVTSIGDWAFYNCDLLTSVTIPDSVISIGDCAFGQCDRLTSIEIGNSVTSIGDSAFWNCGSLKSIIFTGTVEQWNDIVKDNDWNRYTNVRYVQCSDGQVAL